MLAASPRVFSLLFFFVKEGIYYLGVPGEAMPRQHIIPGAMKSTARERIQFVVQINVLVLGLKTWTSTHTKTKVTKNVLKNARKLKSIGAFCIGTDQIDLEVAREFGVSVFETTIKRMLFTCFPYFSTNTAVIIMDFECLFFKPQ